MSVVSQRLAAVLTDDALTATVEAGGVMEAGMQRYEVPGFTDGATNMWTIPPYDPESIVMFWDGTAQNGFVTMDTSGFESGVVLAGDTPVAGRKIVFIFSPL